jgi:hypothetical protein
MASSARSYPASSPEAGPTADGPGQPDAFTRAVSGLRAVQPRPEIAIDEIAAPQKLAPYAFALSGSVLRHGDEVATGRLILLYDPAGHDAWRGEIRLVTYLTAELEADMAADPLLPGVGWSWLVDALDSYAAAYTAIGGTVTTTASSRFGELAGPPTTADIEIRASWSPLATEAGALPAADDISAHMEGWCAFLSSTAGLPPPGVAALR